jgi:predicted DNA-binding transcriptional regulator AlpA
MLGARDIAELLGIQKTRAYELVNRKGFPDPVATINTRTRMWSRTAVVEWAVEHRYDITPPPKP